MRLDPERRAGGGRDGAPHQHVIREDQVGRQQLPERGGVRIHVGSALGRRRVLQELGTQTGIAVQDEHRQHPTGQVGDDNLRPAQVVAGGVAFLTHHDDVVAGAAPRARKRTGVDVRPGPAEQVAVPEKDPHPSDATSWLYAR